MAPELVYEKEEEEEKGRDMVEDQNVAEESEEGLVAKEEVQGVELDHRLPNYEAE